MEKGGHVYILGSTTGTLYIGVTSDLHSRILQHRAGTFNGFSARYHCTRLLYAEPFHTITQAIAREKQLKGWTRAKKLTLITKQNPQFKDQAEHWGQPRVGPYQPLHEPISPPAPSK